MADDIDEHHSRLHAEHGGGLEGHQHIIDHFMAQFSDDTGRRHHGYIFHGPKGVGKATTAYRLAEYLFAHEMTDGGLFGDDAPSPSGDDAEVRLLRGGVHPDMMVIEGDTEKASGGISVDQVRKVVPFLAHTPSRQAGRMNEDGMRLVLIDAMDQMNANGANALLKTLEEPPKNTIIIILSHGSVPVLPTIRSRTQLVKFAPLDFTATQKVIRQQFPAAEQSWIDVAAVLANGAPGVASMLAEAGAPDLYADTCMQLADGVMSGGIMDAMSSQWGAGGLKYAITRQLARHLFDRLLVKAARHAVHATGHGDNNGAYDGPGLDIEERAIARISGRRSAYELTDIRQQLLLALNEAERLNLDAAPVIFNALDALNAD